MTIKNRIKIPYALREGKPLEVVIKENNLFPEQSKEIIDRNIDEFLKEGEIFLHKHTDEIYITKKGFFRLMLLSPEQANFRAFLMDNPEYLIEEFPFETAVDIERKNRSKFPENFLSLILEYQILTKREVKVADHTEIEPPKELEEAWSDYLKQQGIDLDEATISYVHQFPNFTFRETLAFDEELIPHFRKWLRLNFA